MTTRTQARPGETREDFIARVVRTSHPLSDAAMSRIRRLLPPMRRRVPEVDAA